MDGVRGNRLYKHIRLPWKNLGSLFYFYTSVKFDTLIDDVTSSNFTRLA